MLNPKNSRKFTGSLLIFVSCVLPFFLCCIRSEENLRAALNNMGVSGNALEGILDKVKNRHYQVLYPSPQFH